MTKPKIILASASPRRTQLLQGLKLDFITHPSNVSEDVSEPVEPHRFVELLAQRKAQNIAEQYKDENALVIGADTVVVLDGRILGKPKDEADAKQMLTALSGRVHTVYTGLCLIKSQSGQLKLGHSSTEVQMRTLDDVDIQKYIQTGEPMDKAGSYAIQGFGLTLVTSIHGDYFTVVGLPLALLSDYLKEFGLEVL